LADIFLSYAREDHARAQQIAAALTAAGYDVFWDVNIPPGKTWADVIEQKLSTSKAAIVLWSKSSTTSKWVREEARLARDHGKLLPVLIDDAVPPFGFGEIQSADLKNWQGDPADGQWRSLLDALAVSIGGGEVKSAPFPTEPPPAAKPAPVPPTRHPFLSKRRAIVLAIAPIVLTVITGAVIVAINESQTSPQTNTELTASSQPMTARSSGDRSAGYGSEGTDFGIEPINELRIDVSGATPISIPGANVFYTDDVHTLLQRSSGSAFALIDVLEGDHDTIAGAMRMPGVGQGGTFDDNIQRSLEDRLGRATKNNKAATVIFFCAGVHCWESYNAALRARALGYRYVGWYRGGLQAWREAGLPLRGASRPRPPAPGD
jgi:PQQ-dependent catabolism-associated CXXCW motif protein